MILDISDSEFKKLFNDKKLFLPIRWDGNDFPHTLNGLFSYYIEKLNQLTNNRHDIYINTKKVESACFGLTNAINHYLNGFPYKAYYSFMQSMEIFMATPLKIYEKSVTEQFKDKGYYQSNDDSLELFRVTSVNDNRPYGRERVFHTPYNLRSKVSTSRYSIAGYPSLYLATSLDLCCEEIHLNPHQDFALASIFKLERIVQNSNTNIQVIELGVKPQDFLNNEHYNERNKRKIVGTLLENSNVRAAYLLWYPLIAACSYIRVNKKDPFAAEYIIPQLLMQWVRSRIDSQPKPKNRYNQLIGIRYFSCASKKASDMGFNYVFPTSGEQASPNLPFCPVLTKSFYLSTPVYVHDFEHLSECEYYLSTRGDFGFIGS